MNAFIESELERLRVDEFIQPSSAESREALDVFFRKTIGCPGQFNDKSPSD